MRRVAIESPYAGDVARHLRYLSMCILDSFDRGEAPYASHGLYPGALRDDIPNERERGIAAGLVWSEAAEATIVYTDLGVSYGMASAIRAAVEAGRPIEYRMLGAEWEARCRS